jgi:peptide/nickel transport system substrate-binding protein
VNLEEAIRTRRTHKAYGAEPVDRATLTELFELARWAPNHHLTNPWRFRVVGPAALERLKQASGEEAAASSTARRRSSSSRRSATRRTATPPRRPPTSSCCRARPRLATYWRTPRSCTRRRAAPRGHRESEQVLGLLHLGDRGRSSASPSAPVAEIATPGSIPRFRRFTPIHGGAYAHLRLLGGTGARRLGSTGGGQPCEHPEEPSGPRARAHARVRIAACGGTTTRRGGGGDRPAEEGAAAGKAGGEAKANLTSFPDFLDPALAYTQEAWQSLWTVYTPLVSYKHAEGRRGRRADPRPGRGVPEATNGGKTYTLKLRDGPEVLRRPAVKASDFEHTIKRVLNLESGGTGFFQTIVGAEDYIKGGKARADIEGIEADDETGEITINLTEANGAFPYVLSMNFAGMVPSDTPFENQTKNPPPGVGPFKIENVKQNRSYELVKNENYTEIEGIPAAKLDKVSIEIKKNQTRQTQDVIQNRVDYILDPPPADQLRRVKTEFKDRYEEYVTNSTYYYFMNTRVKPFDDKRVRQAVNFAIDKRALARLFGGLLEPGCNFLPPGMQGYEKVEPCPYGDPTAAPDVERAKQLIKEAGVEGDSVTVYGNDEDPSRPTTEYLADVLNQIGFKAKPRIVEGSVYFTTIGNQKTKAPIGFANWFQDFPHPSNFTFLIDPASIQETNNQNFSNVEDPAIGKALEEANKKGIEEAAPEYARVDRRVVEEALVAPYGHRKLANFVSERVDFENCTVTHPVNQLDFTQLCLR